MSLRLVKTEEWQRADNFVSEAPLSPSHTARPSVLHLINSFEIGGTERQAVELLKRIDPERFNVRLAAIRNRGPLYSEIAYRFPEVPEFPLTSFYNANAARQLSRLRSLILRERVRILHAHDFYAGVIGAVAARLSRIKIIACQRHLKLSDRRVHDWGTRLINRLADRIVVNSDAIRDYIVASGAASISKITVIRNGLRSPENLSDANLTEQSKSLRRELGLNAEAKLIGCVANLLPVKGHRYLIKAASRVAQADSNAHFILIGEGPLRAEIEQQAAQLRITARVHLLGHRDDAATLVSSFDLAVLASLREGLPNAVMEAMACAVPVVATSVGGTTELITDYETGYLVAPADAETLSERILWALRHEKESREVARRGQQKIIENFGMSRMVDSVEQVYDELLSNESKITHYSRFHRRGVKSKSGG